MWREDDLRREKGKMDCSQNNDPLIMLSAFHTLLDDHDHAMPYEDEKTISCAGSGKSSFNQIESSPSPRNARGAMHPMITKKKNTS